MNKINIDFTVAKGKVKQLHCINNAPMLLWDKTPVQPSLGDLGSPYCRFHDAGGAWGAYHYVDIPNVFPNFDADENDPASYDFAFTDALLKSVVSVGIKPFYRLGVTIENNWKVKAYNIYPPKDFAKWARICEHIVRHYNEGWADGFEWDLDYWEIWNEPENPPMWQGTREQYYELYRVAANHLKKCFPDIKVGGYAGCGFYAIDDDTLSDFYKSFIPWFEDFLTFISDEKTKAPLDFFSWHIYIDSRGPERIATHAKYVRETLDKAGFTATESLLDEWNDCTYAWGKDRIGFDMMKEMPCATTIAAAMAIMQQTSIDKAMYYDAMPSRAYCGLFYFPGSKNHKLTPTFFTLKAFNELYKLGTAVECSYEGDKIYAIAAKSDSGQGFYIVNRRDEEVTLDLITNGADKQFALYLLDDSHKTLPLVGIWNSGEKLTLPAKSLALLVTDPTAIAEVSNTIVMPSTPTGIDNTTTDK